MMKLKEACVGVECDGTVGLMVLQNAAQKSRTTHLLNEREVSPESMNTLMTKKELTEIQVLRKKQLHDLEKEIGGLELQAKNNAKNNASGPTVEERKKLSDMITLLTDTFEQQLYTENSNDQGTYNIRKAQHQSCIDHKNERFGDSGDVAAAWRRYGTKKPKHKSCRKAQKSLQKFVDAAGVVHGGTWGTMTGNGDTQPKIKAAAICTRRQNFETDLQTYEDTTPLNVVSSDCKDDQRHVEVAYCEWLESKIAACDSFDFCIDLVDLSEEKSYRETREANRVELWKTIQKLKCRLRRILQAFPQNGDASNHSAPDQCANVPDLGVNPVPQELKLDLDVPNAASCSSDDDIDSNRKEPSEANTTKCNEWKTWAYNWATDSAYFTLDECQSTCYLTTTPAPPSQGCNNAPAGDASNRCSFYVAHPDACGGYVEPAGLICCVCGSTPNWPLACSTFTSCSQNKVPIANADQTACHLTGGCDEATCCTLPCSTFSTCNSHNKALITDAQNTPCPLAGCDEHTCCAHNCDTYNTCDLHDKQQIVNADSTQCEPTGCDETKCCQDPPACSTYQCNSPKVHIENAEQTLCLATGCIEATCCQVCATVIDPPETSRQYSFDSRRRQSLSSPPHSTLAYDGVGRPHPTDIADPPKPEYTGWDTSYQAPSEATLRIDLGSTQTISGLKMYNLYIVSGVGPYTVDSSTNGNVWAPVGTFNLIDIPTRTRGLVQFATHEAARYIRIKTTGLTLNVGVVVCPQAP